MLNKIDSTQKKMYPLFHVNSGMLGSIVKTSC